MVEVGAPVRASTRSGSVPSGVSARWSSASSRSAAFLSPSFTSAQADHAVGAVQSWPGVQPSIGGMPKPRRVAGHRQQRSSRGRVQLRPRKDRDGPGRRRVELRASLFAHEAARRQEAPLDLARRGPSRNRVAEEVARDVLSVVLAIAPDLCAVLPGPTLLIPRRGSSGHAISVGIEARGVQVEAAEETGDALRLGPRGPRPRAPAPPRRHPSARRSPSRRARRRSWRRCAGP